VATTSLATEGSDVNSDSLPWATLPADTSYTFVQQMVRLEVRITRLLRIVTCAWATTGTVSVPTTAEQFDEVDETLALLMEPFRLRVQLSTQQRAPSGKYPVWLPVDSGDGIWLIVNPSVYFVLTNGTAGSVITSILFDVTVPAAGAAVSVPTNCGYNWWSDETLQHCYWTVSGYGTIIDNNNRRLWQRSPASP
jgi:hypothetical protein